MKYMILWNEVTNPTTFKKDWIAEKKVYDKQGLINRLSEDESVVNGDSYIEKISPLTSRLIVNDSVYCLIKEV